MYAKIENKRIVNIYSEYRNNLIEILDDNILSNPINYKLEDSTFIYDPMPSVYHSINNEGDWIFDNDIFRNAQNNKWEEIKLYRDNLEEAGIKQVINGVEYWFHTDDKSLIKYLFLLFLCTFFSSQFTQLQWKTMNGDIITLTSGIIINLFFSIINKSNLLHEAGRRHKELMLLSQDPINYNYTEDWP